MTEHYLRYLAIGLGTGLVALGWVLDKLPEEVGIAAVSALLLIAGADMYKHKDDKA